MQNKIPKIFVTGASGFIGRHLLNRLADADRYAVVCLTRNLNGIDRRLQTLENVKWLEGALSDPTSYEQALGQVDTVIHLAAATGASSTDELHRINELGTKTLLEACESANVRQLLFMSSIAVKAGSLADYPYARSKLAAETAVRKSGVSHTILRPTIVLDADAPNWPMLRKLACLPVVPLIGGGRASVQPVDVLDVVRALEWLLEHERPREEIIEIGGPETLTFSAFLSRIRAACGKPGFRSLKIPAGPVRFALKGIQKLLGDRAPVGPGQIAPFVYDGVAEDNTVLDFLRPNMRRLDELLRSISDADRTQ